MRALSIIGIILSPIIIFTSFVVMMVISNLRSIYAQANSMYDPDILHREVEKGIPAITNFIGLSTMIGMIYFIVLFSISIKLIKNNTVKSLGILGIVLSVFMICWDFVMLGSPMAVSFDEVGSAWIVYFLTCLAFSIVMLIQYNRNLRVAKVVYKENVLDDLEFE